MQLQIIALEILVLEIYTPIQGNFFFLKLFSLKQMYICIKIAIIG